MLGAVFCLLRTFISIKRKVETWNASDSRVRSVSKIQTRASFLPWKFHRELRRNLHWKFPPLSKRSEAEGRVQLRIYCLDNLSIMPGFCQIFCILYISSWQNSWSWGNYGYINSIWKGTVEELAIFLDMLINYNK